METISRYGLTDIVNSSMKNRGRYETTEFTEKFSVVSKRIYYNLELKKTGFTYRCE
jgi:hypothetical protein